MVTRSTPGVYFEWHERQAPPALARTDVAGFVGIAERGPLHTPLVVENWSDFRQLFGAHIPAGYLAYAVEGFFLNGGRRCVVVRVADPEWARSAELELRTQDGLAVRLTASSPGAWGQRLMASVTPLVPGRFNLTLRLDDQNPEIWRDLTLDPESEAGRYVVALLNGEEVGQAGSSLVTARAVAPDPCADVPRLAVDGVVASAFFAGGEDGLWSLRPAHLSGRGAPGDAVWGLAALEGVAEVAIVAMPDLMPPPAITPRYQLPRVRCDPPEPPPPAPQPSAPDHPPAFEEAEVRELQRQLIGHCERLKDRIAVLDPRPEDRNPQAVVDWRRPLDSSYAALYYPWLRVPDPLRLDGTLRTIPPSGHIAGLYARVENSSGPHQPPANERLENVRDLTVAVDDVLHGYLNDHDVNLIRAYPGRGLRPMGARTLSSDPQWRYVNVRRLLLALERTLRRDTQWLVFESNDAALQAEVERVLRGLLDTMWLRGMLDGGTADEAYQVVCDRTTNPPSETEVGRLLAVIGIRPPYPAEFVVVRVGRTDQGIQFLEGSEA
jgi:hypothetical protein